MQPPEEQDADVSATRLHFLAKTTLFAQDAPAGESCASGRSAVTPRSHKTTERGLKEMTAWSYESYLIVNISFNGFRDQF